MKWVLIVALVDTYWHKQSSGSVSQTQLYLILLSASNSDLRTLRRALFGCTTSFLAEVPDFFSDDLDILNQFVYAF